MLKIVLLLNMVPPQFHTSHTEPVTCDVSGTENPCRHHCARNTRLSFEDEYCRCKNKHKMKQCKDLLTYF